MSSVPGDDLEMLPDPPRLLVVVVPGVVIVVATVDVGRRVGNVIGSCDRKL